MDPHLVGYQLFILLAVVQANGWQEQAFLPGCAERFSESSHWLDQRIGYPGGSC